MADNYIVKDGLSSNLTKASKDIGSGVQADKSYIPDGYLETLGLKSDAVWDGVSTTPTAMALWKYIASGVMDTSTPSATSDTGIVSGGTTLTRPADTTPYAIGDLIANDTTAANVTPIAFPSCSKVAGGSGWITGLRLTKSGTSITNASFRLHVFRGTADAAVVTATNGDNGAFLVNGIALFHIGVIDITMDQVFTDGAKGSAAPARNVLGYVTNGGTRLFGLLEARNAYTPVSGEVFTATLELTRGI